MAGRPCAALAGGFRLCRLLRADGSRFAQAESTGCGRCSSSASSVVPARSCSPQTRNSRPRRRQRGPTSVATTTHTPTSARATGSSPTSGGSGKTPSNLAADKVVQALRSAYSEWANNINWCDLTDNAKAQSDYQGRTELKAKQDGKNVVHWGNLEDVQGCEARSPALPRGTTSEGNPVESDIRFSTAEEWSISPDAGSYDIQSVAAHEFGHVRQFDHVTTGDNTVVMWPYISRGDTSLRKLGRGDSRGNNTEY